MRDLEGHVRLVPVVFLVVLVEQGVVARVEVTDHHYGVHCSPATNRRA